MCTAFGFCGADRYFGRNLDFDISFGEEVCVMPRRFSLPLRHKNTLHEHYAVMGMAAVLQNTPLFYDAVNEWGLAMAGLYFPENAFYPPPTEGKNNIATFELIPYLLGQCKTVEDAKAMLSQICITHTPFSQTLPPAPLHWIVSDGEHHIVAESMKDGLHIYDNPVGVLTNNPPFPYQLENLRNYTHLQSKNPPKVKSNNLPYSTHSQGLGALGLPGDVSSMSRFVRMAFGKNNATAGEDELSSLHQVFHLLSLVEMVKGLCKTEQNKLDFTRYSACINLTKGLYCYTTYDNRRITCVDMHKTDLEGNRLFRFPLIQTPGILYQKEYT